MLKFILLIIDACLTFFFKITFYHFLILDFSLQIVKNQEK